MCVYCQYQVVSLYIMRRGGKCSRESQIAIGSVAAASSCVCASSLPFARCIAVVVAPPVVGRSPWPPLARFDARSVRHMRVCCGDRHFVIAKSGLNWPLAAVALGARAFVFSASLVALDCAHCCTCRCSASRCTLDCARGCSCRRCASRSVRIARCCIACDEWVHMCGAPTAGRSPRGRHSAPVVTHHGR